MRVRSIYSFRYGVFDNDGTLVDSMGYCAPFFADVVTRLGVPHAAAVAYYRRTVGKPMREQYREALAAHGIAFSDGDIESLRRDFDRRFLETDVKFFPGARRALRVLSRRQRLFLSSAAPDACVLKRLAAGNVARYFTVAYGSNAVPKGRRHLELFADVADMTLEDFAERAYFCGDGEVDMDIASRAGLYAIGIRGTVSDARLRRAGARRIVSSVGELLADPR